MMESQTQVVLFFLSSQSWGSRNATPSVELNNLLNFNGTFMTPLAAAIHQLPTTSRFLQGIDSINSYHVVVPDLRLGRNSQPLRNHLPGEHDVWHKAKGITWILGCPEPESPHWSL